MSATLFALVVLQGTTLSFSPGYTSAAECMRDYTGRFVSCFAYDPEGSSWTAFFQLPDGSFRQVGRIREESECKRYVGAFKEGTPTACRQLAMPNPCIVACRAPEQPSPPPAVKPDTSKTESNQPPAAWLPLPARSTFATLDSTSAEGVGSRAEPKPPSTAQQKLIVRRTASASVRPALGAGQPVYPEGLLKQELWPLSEAPRVRDRSIKPRPTGV